MLDGDGRGRVREIRAKTLLARTRNPESWFGADYTLNIYRGCHHGCIYCDSRSECYGITDFEEVQVKANVLDLLARELVHKPYGKVVGTGAMSDPYVPPERTYNLTGRALGMILAAGLGIHIVTKSDMVTRDAAILARLAQIRASVAFTVTTTDDRLAGIVEPGAPSPSRRFAAMAQLAEAGVLTGVTLMPVLPLIQDTPQAITDILERTAAAGGRFAVAYFGLTMRNRQREHFYEQLDRHFPGVRVRYEALYGGRYSCLSPQARALRELSQETCGRLGLLTDMRAIAEASGPPRPRQLSLF